MDRAHFSNRATLHYIDQIPSCKPYRTSVRKSPERSKFGHWDQSQGIRKITIFVIFLKMANYALHGATVAW